MRRNAVGAIWILGLLVTVVIYAGGADEVLRGAVSMLAWLRDLAVSVLAHMAIRFDALLRALAIALYLVFLALGTVAIRRGVKAKRALVLVTAMILLLLVGPVWDGDGVSQGRWTLAFALSTVAALVMTQRLRDAGSDVERWNAR